MKSLLGLTQLGSLSGVAMVLRGGQVCTFGPEVREVFYCVLWREYGVGPTTLETMARAGTLATGRLPHPCGKL